MHSADERPEPDQLLRRIQADERSTRAKLKIFLGFAPGVGKTYRMLQNARELVDENVDVVVGAVETHGRYETASFTLGLEILPRDTPEYRVRTPEEFNLDAALARKPQVLLLDELAHTNLTGSRHTKRWQDVLELLDAGIEVHTTLNVQHVESLNDVIAQITHIQVRETVPDALLDRADEIELVDVSLEELLGRLRDGKVYVPAMAERAVRHFFQPGNLLALRELALLSTARRVDTEMQAWRHEHGVGEAAPVAEHVLVCVGPSPVSAVLVRAAKRMAAGLRATWTAATVETPGQLRLSADDRARIGRHLRLAEQLGARIVTLHGDSMSSAALEFARREGVTRIVIGKPTHPRWRDVLFGSMLEEVVRGSGHIDVHVISGTPEEPAAGGPSRSTAPSPRRSPQSYVWAALLVGSATIIAGLVYGRVELTEIVMVYLLGIVVVAVRFGRGPALFASALSVAAFDFCFVPPRFTFAVADVRHLLTFAVMFGVGLVIGTLTARVRQQAVAAELRERRTAVLYDLTRDLAGAQRSAQIASVAVRHLTISAGSAVAILLPDEDRLEVVAGEAGFFDDRERAVAEWVLEHEQPAGATTDTLSAAKALYLPLRASAQTLGVLAVSIDGDSLTQHPEQRQLLDTLGRQTAMALERAFLSETAHDNRVRADREELRSALLSSVSHDLRTPLAAITGAASTLLAQQNGSEAVRRELLETIFEEADRLNRLVGNLLDMTRLESGGMVVHKEWTPLEEVIGAALNRIDEQLAGRTVTATIPEDLPLVPLDGVLMEQMFFNLLENAVKYTPAGAPIDISARLAGDSVEVELADRGPGLEAGSEQRVFDKFYRRVKAGVPGTGLGLAICRGIVTAHGGAITAERREGGGALFRLRLPLGEGAPALEREPLQANLSAGTAPRGPS
jgi:two-component system sensor histidine kinase KdpD